MTNPKKINLTKACILAAGEGKRLAPLTETRPKPLIPIAGTPLLQHTISSLKECGITEILLIIGYKKEQIIDYFEDGARFGVKISYIEQKEFLGTGHATQLAENFANSNPFMLIYGDLFMDTEIYSSVKNSFEINDFHGIISAKSMDDPTKWGILNVDSDGILQKLVEKPSDDRFGNLANTGVYVLSPSIFDALQIIPKSPRGEYELTDAITHRMGEGDKFQVLTLDDLFWSDVGHPWQLLDATRHVIDQLPGEKTTKKYLPSANIINQGGTIEDFVTVHGTVVLGKNSIVKSGSYIEGPMIIGDDCVIGPNAYLRPYTVLGNHCKIGNASEVKASIIMDHTAIPHLSYVGDSIIGEHVNFGCGSITANLRLDKKQIPMIVKDTTVATGRKKLGTIIGDHAQIGIQVSIMPGKNIGSYAFVGSNTIVSENIPSYHRYYSKSTTHSKLRK
ncbi:MAG: bifunctional sugar-1-phosphate nucleotidylyltransferase/acetyltransferase [Promethearchaeota archaeon]